MAVGKCCGGWADCVRNCANRRRPLSDLGHEFNEGTCKSCGVLALDVFHPLGQAKWSAPVCDPSLVYAVSHAVDEGSVAAGATARALYSQADRVESMANAVDKQTGGARGIIVAIAIAGPFWVAFLVWLLR